MTESTPSRDRRRKSKALLIGCTIAFVIASIACYFGWKRSYSGSAPVLMVFFVDDADWALGSRQAEALSLAAQPPLRQFRTRLETLASEQGIESPTAEELAQLAFTEAGLEAVAELFPEVDSLDEDDGPSPFTNGHIFMLGDAWSDFEHGHEDPRTFERLVKIIAEVHYSKALTPRLSLWARGMLDDGVKPDADLTYDDAETFFDDAMADTEKFYGKTISVVARIESINIDSSVANILLAAGSHDHPTLKGQVPNQLAGIPVDTRPWLTFHDGQKVRVRGVVAPIRNNPAGSGIALIDCEMEPIDPTKELERLNVEQVVDARESDDETEWDRMSAQPILLTGIVASSIDGPFDFSIILSGKNRDKEIDCVWSPDDTGYLARLREGQEITVYGQLHYNFVRGLKLRDCRRGE